MQGSSRKFLTPPRERAGCMQMATLRTWALALTGALGMASSISDAQQGPIVASPGVVVGAVTDANGRPLEADVTFGSSKNRETTGPDGRFRFADVKAGKYTMAARRVGYFPRTTSVEIGDSGAVVMLALVALPNKLPPVITEAERGGLSGHVGDTLFGPLPNAVIEVIGENRRATTDSSGEFYIPIGTGKYMVKVSRPNFATRMVSVTVPVTRGRRMEVALIPASRATSNRDEAAARGLQARLIRRNAAYSKLFTAEDIEKIGFKSLGQVASSGAVQYVDNSCPVMLPALAENEAIEGMPRGAVPLWSLDAADLEFVEIYTAKPPRQSQTSIGRGAPRSVRRPPPPKCPQIIAWLKK
jgi:hypothetical protein